MGTISVPDAEKIESYDELLFFEVEVGIFRNKIGSYAVIMREGKDAKGMLCVSLEQACDIFDVCKRKLRNRYVVLN